MSITPIVIQRSVPGANTLGGADGTSALLLIVPASAIPASSSVKDGIPFVVHSLSDLESKGFTAVNDTTNGALIHYHVQEFYKHAAGTKLYIMLVVSGLTGTVPNQAASVKLTELFDNALYAQKLIDSSVGDITLLAVGTSVIPQGSSAAYLNGLPDYVYNSIAKAQAFADKCFAGRKPLHVLIEGREWQGNASASADLLNIPNVKAGNVSVVIAQDYDYTFTLNASALKKHAAVGTLLGMCAKLGVANNPGEINQTQNNLTEVATARWVTAGLSNHIKVSEQRASLGVLDGKGYIFALDYTPYDGVYFNDGRSCNAEVRDSNGNLSIASIMLSRVTNKVARILYVSLMPYVKRKYLTDSSTGKLPSGVIKEIEAYASDQLLPMLRAQEIAGVAVKVDPDSDLLSGDKILKIESVRIVPFGYAGSITIGLTLNNTL